MTPGGAAGGQVVARPRSRPPGAASVAPAARPRTALARWETAAFLAALLVYAVTRFWRLGEYPLFFFTDEALEPLMAEQLLAHGFRDAAGRLFPVYFENGGAWAPVLPVYAHVISLSLFGKSVEVARGTAAFVTLLGAGAVGLLLKSVFRTPLWWTGPLILATTPAWFLHSRTTFETVFMVSAYAGFLLCYLLYRVRSPWFLYPAILCAGATFYSYTNGQAVIGLTALLLAVVDAPYHLRRWRYVLPGIALAAVVAVPLLVFQRAQPDATAGQLTRVSSYLFERLPLGEKARRFAVEYGRGLGPAYWFFSPPPDLSRHVMGPHPHLRTAMLPFVVLGVLVCLRRLRQAPYRTVLIAALAAPIGASLAAVAITRVLAFVVPATVLAVLGLSAVFGLLRPRSLRLGAGVLTFAILAGSSLGLLREALTDGPRWDRDYGLYGQQWGAVQLFGVIPEILRAEPRTRILLSPTWANGTDLLPRFFLRAGSPEAARVTIANATGFLSRRQELTPDMLFILTPGEYEEARNSPKLAAVALQRTLAYPDGRPGFYFVRLAYVPDVDAVFAAEREARRVLVADTAVLAGETLGVRHSRLDIGRPGDLFDGEARTLVRFMEENPAVLELRFARPRRIARVDLLLTAGDWEVTARLDPDADGATADARRTARTTRSARADTQVEVVLAATPQEALEVDVLRLEIRLLNVPESPKIHLREVQLR